MKPRALCQTISLVTAVISSESAFSLDEAREVQSIGNQSNSSRKIEEVVVTAQKREQSLNDIGMAVSVLSGSTLEKLQIISQQDLAEAIPGLSYATTPNGTPVFTLRGIGFYEVSLAAYPTVSSYIDEVPLAFPVLGTHVAYDLERIEVLKGPQGTLFGQNATGGAINYIAAKPTDEFEAAGRLSYGRFDLVRGEGYLSGPLSETVSARASIRLEERDGWQQSQSRQSDELGKLGNYMGRLQLSYQPTEGMSFLLNLNGWIDKSDTQAPQYIALQPQNPIISDKLAQAELSQERPRVADWSPGLPFRDNRMWQSSLRADIDVSDNVTLTSLTSYVDYRQRQGDEGDGLPINVLDLRTNEGQIESFSQEIRFSSSEEGSLYWVVGANYDRSSVDQRTNVFFPDTSFNATLSPITGYFITNSDNTSDQDMENYAAFASVEYEMNRVITLKGGVRYTKAEREGSICSSEITGSPIDTGAFFFDIALAGAFGSFEAGDCYAINNLSESVNGVVPGAPGRYVDKLDEDNVSWRIGVDANAADNLLLYANVAEGYKAGSFPQVSASAFLQYVPVTQESVISYEAGLKSGLFEQTVQFNLAAFYYDYTDKQLRSKTIDPVFGTLDILQNIPESRVRGLELEVQAQPLQGLTLSAAFTYLDAEIEKFVGINASGLAADFAGSRVPFTPEYQGVVSVDYEFPLTGSLVAALGASLNARSDTVSVVGGDTNPDNVSPSDFKVFGIKSYETLDLRASLYGQNEKWGLSIWGRNVTDSYYWNNVVTGFDQVARYAAPPRTWGVTFDYRY
jgi:iron complex outermembrane receptor protein